MVFFGDLFQLPPVVRRNGEEQLFEGLYDTPYFFSAHVVRRGLSLEMIELRKVYRQENRHFLRLLEAIRLNQVDYDDLEELNERHLPGFEARDDHITLTATNARADRINRRSLDAIPLPARRYTATVTGDFKPGLFPTELALDLKLHAQVMFIKNDPERAFVNGTIGRISKMEDDAVTVRVTQEDGSTRDISTGPLDWEILRYVPSTSDPNGIDTEVVGTFRQLPLRLAWAVTIHKSQGKTFDRVIIDLGRGAFEHGQTYVALSRCRTLEGIVLRQALRPSDIRTDPRVVEFYERHA
jgi:ATP-dependent exoDNAse (exonuclease V) alpha subunit